MLVSLQQKTYLKLVTVCYEPARSLYAPTPLLITPLKQQYRCSFFLTIAQIGEANFHALFACLISSGTCSMLSRTPEPQLQQPMDEDCKDEKVIGREDQAGDDFIWWMEEVTPALRPSQVGEPGAEHRGKACPATIILVTKICVGLTTDIGNHASITHRVPRRQPQR